MAVCRKVSSLVLLRKDASVLLGYKKRGFGAGKWNGFGGKKEEGESMFECAQRELLEESGLKSDQLEVVGSLEFEFVQDPMFMDVTVYTARHFTGEPKETDEMKPCWFAEDEIPYDKMWADDQIWFPFFLKGLNFRGRFRFHDNETLLWHEIEAFKPGTPPYNPTNACKNCLEKQEENLRLHNPYRKRQSLPPRTCPHFSDDWDYNRRPDLASRLRRPR